MDPLTPDELKASFVNTSKSQRKALPLPADLASTPWHQLDYLGWRDPRSPGRAYLVAPHRGDVVGLALRAPGSAGGRKRSSICALCWAVRTSSEVDLLVAPRAGAAGRAGNTVGTYVCADLACSANVRGLRKLELPQGETLPVPQRVERLQQRLEAFVDRAVAA
ncbi:FBP domain-containing protein [Angustibacter peucedani]